MRHFNPRTPCGVRRLVCHRVIRVLVFQSTHPLRGATQGWNWTLQDIKEFQSTHPLRGATCRMPCYFAERMISIHAPLAGCDPSKIFAAVSVSKFNPRTPCGVRPPHPAFSPTTKKFQSTHPLRGATAWHSIEMLQEFISIHAPLAGCDFHKP